MSTLLKLECGDRVIYTQDYLISVSPVPFGALGEVVRLTENGDTAVVDFDELGCITVPAFDLELEPELTSLPIEPATDAFYEELIHADKNTLVREKLLAQESDPDLDHDISLALQAHSI